MATNALPSARVVRESTAMQVVGRAGMVTRGLMHLLVALLVVEVVRGRPTEQADSRGAISTVARQPFGRVLVGLIALGLAGYALWRAVQAVLGRDGDDGAWKRLSAGGRALLYGALALVAGRAVMNGSGSKAQSAGGGQQGQQATATALSLPGGRFLVAAAGLALLAVAAVNGYRAVTRRFEGDLRLDRLSSGAKRLTLCLGVGGYAGRGLAYALTGGLLIVGAVQHDPSSGEGLDRALHRVAAVPHGRLVLIVLAAGLAAFGVYQLVEARHRDVAE